MAIRYAYSFDRETFTGSFSTREKALADALVKCFKEEVPPPTVYIGQVIPPDPHAAGNAEDVIDNMRRRVRIDVGEAANSWLKNLTSQQIEELDVELKATILAWMTRHDLLPEHTKIGAISEHTVPSAPTVPSGSASEVQDLGPEFP